MPTKTVRIPQELYDYVEKKAKEVGLGQPSLYLRILLKKAIDEEKEKKGMQINPINPLQGGDN